MPLLLGSFGVALVQDQHRLHDLVVRRADPCVHQCCLHVPQRLRFLQDLLDNQLDELLLLLPGFPCVLFAFSVSASPSRSHVASRGLFLFALGLSAHLLPGLAKRQFWLFLPASLLHLGLHLVVIVSKHAVWATVRC